MNGVIDFHTHAFPDDLAARAIAHLEKEGNVKACLNGTVTDLLRSMDRAGIEKSVICSIATRPQQFNSILEWSKSIRSDRLVPLPSIHPLSENPAGELRIIAGEGFPGIKMHPYYQDFALDAEEMAPIYEALIDNNLMVVMHTGFDIAFPRIPLCDPARIIKVLDDFPGLKMITTHLGAWDHWDEARRLLIGRPVYMELSYALDFLDADTARQMIISHPPEYLLFGSDSPWSDQENTLRLLRRLELDPVLFRNIVRDNGKRLLAG
ncbi:MAG: amidohydrolase family protein [Desulfobulbaceae bacterium]|nr:amidohydrolase family protein [Desulfobulbaceae bacterium]MDY0351983.1 amidohydrolase family protein [Desulfobulbaceae bacterium]